ncbi:MAG: hypothetical protein HY063_03465 [Bacteroidetes bacterium]|nr:hypothetical protein [Bacteroidota bacterium]
MKKLLLGSAVAFIVTVSPSCFLRIPIKVEREYYRSGNIKIKHWYYAHGVRERVRYYSDNKTRTKTKKGKIVYQQKPEKK